MFCLPLISDSISTLDLDEVYKRNALLLTLASQRAEIFRHADLEHARLLEDFRCSIRDELAMGDEGCPNSDGRTSDDLPIETWVGGTIRSVAIDSFLMQIRGNEPGIHSPNMICNFGGEKRDGESPSETYIREYDEEFLGSKIFDYSLIDILRIYPVRTSWGGVIRVVFDLIIPTIPEPLRIGEGIGYQVINADRAATAAGITALSKEDLVLVQRRASAPTKYLAAIRKILQTNTRRLDGDIFGGEGYPHDQY
jgi:hypothetical protein